MDVDTNPNNPVIGSRAFSRDPASVSSMGAAYIGALQAQGGERRRGLDGRGVSMRIPWFISSPPLGLLSMQHWAMPVPAQRDGFGSFQYSQGRERGRAFVPIGPASPPFPSAASLPFPSFPHFRVEPVAACAKHFPGHGDTSVDSHLDLPLLPHSRARLQAVELPPFRAAVDADVAAVLIAHVAVPALSSPEGGRPGSANSSASSASAGSAAAAAAGPAGRPATMSPGALSVLREDIGFGGLVLSDDLEMGAITKHYGTGQAVVEGLAAGVDLFLVCHTEEKQEAAIAALVEAVKVGALPWAKVQAAGRRYDRVAAAFVRPHAEMAAGGARITLIGCQEHRQLVADILRKGMSESRP